MRLLSTRRLLACAALALAALAASASPAGALTDEPDLVIDLTTEGGSYGGYLAGGGEYTQASVLSTNDRFVENSIEELSQPVGIAQDGGIYFDVYGGGLALSGIGLGLEGRNLVAAGNEIADGSGGGVSSDRASRTASCCRAGPR